MSVQKVVVAVGKNFSLSTQKGNRTTSVTFFNGKYLIAGKKIPAKFVTLEYPTDLSGQIYYAFGKKYYVVEKNTLELVTITRNKEGEKFLGGESGNYEIALLKTEGRIEKLSNRPYPREGKLIFKVIGLFLAIPAFAGICYGISRVVMDNLWRFM